MQYFGLKHAILQKMNQAEFFILHTLTQDEYELIQDLIQLFNFKPKTCSSIKLQIYEIIYHSFYIDLNTFAFNFHKLN